MSGFPILRPRRLRENAALRDMIAEHRLIKEQLIMPLFLKEGKKVTEPINSMPGLFRLSPDMALKECEKILNLGLKGVLLFGLGQRKDAVGSEAYDPEGVVAKTLRLLKKELPELVLFVDVCLCEYTDHGHCGVLKTEDGKTYVDNDATLELLSKVSSVYARSGADVIAPSDMMDGRVQVIRDELDAAGFKHLPILSYAAKYASHFYGPFRDALDCAPKFGDRRSYQMDPANVREALREVEEDILQGADMVMVKPAMPYLDVISKIKDSFSVPVAAYQVSGEYSMIKQAVQAGIAHEEQMVKESLTCIKRAGADLIITYFAADIAKKL